MNSDHLVLKLVPPLQHSEIGSLLTLVGGRGPYRVQDSHLSKASSSLKAVYTIVLICPSPAE
jgi:hypothetical protein